MSKKDNLSKLFENFGTPDDVQVVENKAKASDSDVVAHFVKEYTTRTEKPTVEETHKRVTFLLDKDVLRRLDLLASNKKRGYKTQVFNTAVAMMVSELEKMEREGE